MKCLLLSLLLITGCSVNRFYRTSDVKQELKQNGNQLNSIAWGVDKDFQDKAAFYNNYFKESKNKDTYIMQDLSWRLLELRKKRDLIVKTSEDLKALNDELLINLDNKKKVSESDPEFKKIETFAHTTRPAVKVLFSEYVSYRNASTQFAEFALFTGNVWKKSTRTE